MGFHSTYNSRYGHYIVHTKYGGVQFNKYEMGLPYIDAKKTGKGLRKTFQGNF